MSDLLKVKVGRSDYLCKWDDNIIYEFNINNFNIDTLKDGDRQWNITGSSITLNKDHDGLVVNFVGGTKSYFDCTFPEFLEMDKFKLTYKAGTSSYLGYRSFFGYTLLSFTGSGSTVDAFWRRYNNSWSNVYPGQYAVPVTAEMIFTKNINHFDVDITLNGTYLGDTQCDICGDITHNIDYNGSSASGSIKIYELKIEKLK